MHENENGKIENGELKRKLYIVYLFTHLICEYV